MAVLLFAVVVFVWGLNWPVTKMIVESMPPLWATALRFAIAGVCCWCCSSRRAA